MKSIIKKTVLAIFLSTTIIAISVAQPRQGRGYGAGQGVGYGNGQAMGYGNGQGMGNPGQQCLFIENRIPDLTEDQKTELLALRTAHLIAMKDFRNEQGEIGAKQRTAMSENTVDQKDAESLIDQKTELMNKQMKAQVAHLAAIKSVLTEEQVLALEAFQPRRQFANNNGRSNYNRAGYGRSGNGKAGYGRSSNRRGGNYGQNNGQGFGRNR